MKNSFIKSIILLVSGSLVAQLCSIITTPIKTRLFTVEDVGFFTYVTTVVGIFSPVIMGQYEAVIVLIKKHVYGVIKLCILLCIFSTIIITLGASLYYLYHGVFTDNLALIIYMPICLLVTGVINLLSAYNNRCREYKLIARIHVIRAVANLLGVIVFGWLGTGYIGLLIVALISQLVSLKKQAESLIKHIRKIYNVRSSILVMIAKKYWQHPVIGMPGDFINTLSYSLIAICVKYIYNDFTILGHYAMSMALLGMPLGIVSSNVGKVFFEEAAREKNSTGKFYHSFLKTTKYLLVGTIPVFVIIYILAPCGCKVFLGSNWESTGVYIRYLVPMFAVRFIVSPLTLSVIIAQKQYYNLMIQSMFLLSLFICYYATISEHLSIENFLMIINWCYTFVYLFFWIMCRRLSLMTT